MFADVPHLRRMLARTVRDLGDLLFPISCVGCQRPGEQWCIWCRRISRHPVITTWAEYGGASEPVSTSRLSLGAPPLSSGQAFEALALQRRRLAIASAAPYIGSVRRALIAYKEGGRVPLARPLGALLSAAVEEIRRTSPPNPISLVPAPSTRASTRARGFDHVALLGRQVGLSIVTPLRSTPRQDQTTLSRQGRKENVRGRIHCATDLRGQQVILIDDLVTTGATLAESALVLEQANADVLGAAVCARTILTSPMGSSVRYASDTRARSG